MTKGEAVLKRLVSHLRANVVAYVALMVAVVFGGGGYAVAATSHKVPKKTAIVACVSKSGEMFLHPGSGKCAHRRHKIRWNIKGKTGATGATGAPGANGATGATGAPGAPAPSIFASVNTDLVAQGTQPPAEQGMTVARAGTGTYNVTITDPVCAKSGYNAPTVTPIDRAAVAYPQPPTTAAPVAYVDGNLAGNSFTVHVGYVDSTGTFVPTDYDFDVHDTCVNTSA